MGSTAAAPTGKLPPLPLDDAGQSIVPNLIAGAPKLLPSSASFPVISALTQKPLHYGQTATPDLAIAAVDDAAAAFKTYKKSPVNERRRMLHRAIELFNERSAEFVKRQCAETSSAEPWAAYCSGLTADIIGTIAAGMAEVLTGAIPPSQTGATSLVFKEPMGVVLLIPPWNAGNTLVARGIANALAAGCTVVLKASELSPATHALTAQTFLDAGFLPGSVNVVAADRAQAAPVTEALVSHPAVRIVEFIGSAPVGRRIAELAGRHLKPVVMELGDQSPAVVLDDAELERAAQLAALGAVMHMGQVCFSTERVIVQRAVSEEFARLLAEEMRKLASVGGEGGTFVTAAQAQKAKGLLDEAVKGGAKFLVGDAEMAGAASLKPSILTDVPKESGLVTSEVFAPVAALKVVNTEEEAIAAANAGAGGLSASVFTKSFERGLRVARELEFGGVQINNMTLFAEPGGPVTGVRGSGWGSNNGRYGIEHFLYNKNVSLTPTDTGTGQANGH